MRVEATVHEWAHALAAVEMLAGDVLEHFLVLLYQLVLFRATLHHMIRGYDQVAVSPAYGACAEVMFAVAFVVCGTPPANAFQAERVVAVVKDAELPIVREYLLEADAALVIECELPLLRLLLFLIIVIVFIDVSWVVVPAGVAIAAVAPFEVFTHSEAVRVLKEQVYNGIIILHLCKLLLADAIEYFLCMLCLSCLLKLSES